MEKTLAIIGGGAAGLCAAKHMLSSSQGLKLIPVIFEQKDCVGGTWVYEDVEESTSGEVFSSMYKSLRSNLPKQVMNFPDFPFPDETPSYMHHSEVVEYLKSYAEHFDLLKYIQFNTKVVDVEPAQDGRLNPITTQLGETKWIVTSQSKINGEMKKSVFDGVIICNGHYSVPYIADIPGFSNYRKSFIHSHYYRDPEQFKGKTVLVLGFGPSGRDIALELSTTCPKVHLSHNGERCQSKLPDNLVEHLGVSHVDENGLIVFTTDEAVDVDVFLFCTGYLVHVPFINKQKFNINIKDGRFVTGLYKHIFFIEEPSLCIVGLPWQTAPFPLMHQQCGYIAKVFAGLRNLPSKTDMELDTRKKEEDHRSSNLPEKYFHKLGTKQFEYMDMLASLSGCPRNPPIIEKLYCYTGHFRRTDVMNYKNMEFRKLNEEEFEVVT